MDNLVIEAIPLTINTFEPYGTAISPDEEIETFTKDSKIERNANQGTATKIVKISKIQNGTNSTLPNFNLFRCYANKLLNNGTTIYLNILEKHPQSSQTFIPIGASSSNNTHLVVVALSDKSDNTRPDLSTMKAFICKGNQGITYDMAVWHAPMIALDIANEKSYVDFSVLNYETGNVLEPLLDCVEYLIEDPVEMRITPSV